MQVAFIGLGTMGLSMARNILNAGFPLTVYNRTAEKAAILAGEGALRAETPAAAAAGAEAVLVCVSDTPDVESVLLGENGVVHGAAAGTLVADMSTISPTATREMAQQLAQKQIRMLDAPVSGGAEGARNATLSIMVGGDAGDLARIRPVFEAMGRTITRIGPVGAGQLAKAVNQTIICGTYLGVVEGLVRGLHETFSKKMIATCWSKKSSIIPCLLFLLKKNNRFQYIKRNKIVLDKCSQEL